MKGPGDITDTERDLITGKIAELSALYTVIMGGTFDISVVGHRKHTRLEACRGTFLMQPSDVTIEEVHGMLMQSLVLVEAAIIQAAQEETVPVGATIN